MNNKFAIIALLISLFGTSLAIAQEEGGEEGNSSKHKSDIIANLNQEKALIDQEISCINSTKGKHGIEKCRNQRMAGMDKLRQQRIEKQKERLQNQLKKLDEKSKETPRRGRDKKEAE